MMARLILWNSIGASRDPLDVFSFGLSPGLTTGAFFFLFVYRRVPNEAASAALGQSVMTHPLPGGRASLGPSCPGPAGRRALP